jgi:Asp-tRNA(Asn)/Glu-tRNA(Gln) amidotransferase A subunit family amidase
LKVQVPDAWPNLFRQSRFLSAVDYVQADRLRRKVAMEMARLMSEVDLLLVPSLRGEMMTIANFTGHPSLTLRTGFVEVGEARSDWAPDPAHPLPRFDPPRRVPHGVTLVGRLFDEACSGASEWPGACPRTWRPRRRRDSEPRLSAWRAMPGAERRSSA